MEHALSKDLSLGELLQHTAVPRVDDPVRLQSMSKLLVHVKKRFSMIIYAPGGAGDPFISSGTFLPFGFRKVKKVPSRLKLSTKPPNEEPYHLYEHARVTAQAPHDASRILSSV